MQTTTTIPYSPSFYSHIPHPYYILLSLRSSYICSAHAAVFPDATPNYILWTFEAAKSAFTTITTNLQASLNYTQFRDIVGIFIGREYSFDQQIQQLFHHFPKAQPHLITLPEFQRFHLDITTRLMSSTPSPHLPPTITSQLLTLSNLECHERHSLMAGRYPVGCTEWERYTDAAAKAAFIRARVHSCPYLNFEQFFNVVKDLMGAMFPIEKAIELFDECEQEEVGYISMDEFTGLYVTKIAWKSVW